ncbi:MAG: membrane dipeptidase [Rikenellaceae bacterium]
MIFDYKKGFNSININKLDKKPKIAISAHIVEQTTSLAFLYSQAIIDAGAVPIILAVNSDNESIFSILEDVDGVLLSGGADIDAFYFGEENIEGLTDISKEKDFMEFMLLRAAMDRGLPILGICRGFQVINVALGGSIYQDIPTMYPTVPLNHSILTDKHLGVHNITIKKELLLHTILECDSISVNSRHHQALKAIAPQLKVSATTSDGIVEAVEGYPVNKILAVQWHPENMAVDGENMAMKRLFSFFVSEASLYQKARIIHKTHPIVDSHCDTPMLYESGGFDFASRNQNAKVDLVKMREGRVDTTITVAYLPQSTPKELATDKAVAILNRFKSDIEKCSDYIGLASSMEDIKRLKSEGKKSVMLGIENGIAIGENISNINMFQKMGVVYITLCHNGTNQICDSARGESLYNGVSEFGKAVISRMNSLGVTIDVSHSSEKSTFDAIKLSAQPIIASHSSCKSLCDHPRNLSDEAIIQIAKSGGVVQVCGYGGFLKKEGTATIIDLIAHIEHIISLTGYDSVGVGSDFDGDGGVEGFDGANEFKNVTIELLRRGHSEENIAKIMGGNIMRVISQNQNSVWS